MSGAPALSVLLPVRDAAATLGAALRSVARQRDADLECVVVDDGSQDASPEVAEQMRRRDPRFHLLRRPRQGLVPALVAGLARCRGRFVARMDADDLMHRERLARQRAALEAHPEWVAVGCHVRLFPRRTLAPGMRAYERWLNHIDGPQRLAREAFVECPVAHPTLLARSEALRAMGYRDAGWPEDYDLVLRWLAAGRRIGMVPRRLLAWRDHPQRLSRRHPRYALDRFTACKAAFLARGFLAGRDHYQLWGYGGTGRALRRALAEHGKRPSRIVEVHPGRLGQRIHGAPVVSPDQLGHAPDEPLVVSVAGTGPRGEVRRKLASLRFEEGRHFVCAA